MVAPALLAIVAAMLLVRLGWERRGSVAAAGWALAAVALVWLGWQAGAWGVATGVVVGMGGALAAVLHAGWRSPVKTTRPPRESPAIAIPYRAGDVARRLAVFALTVPVAFVAAQGLAFAVHEAARAQGMGAADAIVLMLMLQPVLWAGIVAVQMTRAGAAQMVLPPLVAAMAGGALWSIA